MAGWSATPPVLLELPPHYVESNGLHAYHDSSWGKAPHAWGGYAVTYMGGALTWKASKLKLVADSSAEAETAVGSKAAKAVVAVRAVLDELDAPVAGATAMVGDNQAARDTIVKPGCTARTRHYERAMIDANQNQAPLLARHRHHRALLPSAHASDGRRHLHQGARRPVLLRLPRVHHEPAHGYHRICSSARQSPILAAVAQGSRHIADAAHLYTSPATQTLPAPTATALPQLYTCLRQVGDASQLAD
eukprot:scaffold6972_cov135-Isochrysis_galbana.AAC.2